jgi:hypothetical protein
MFKQPCFLVINLVMIHYSLRATVLLSYSGTSTFMSTINPNFFSYIKNVWACFQGYIVLYNEQEKYTRVCYSLSMTGIIYFLDFCYNYSVKPSEFGIISMWKLFSLEPSTFSGFPFHSVSSSNGPCRFQPLMPLWTSHTYQFLHHSLQLHWFPCCPQSSPARLPQSLFFFYFWQYWGLNSGPHNC